MRPLLNANPLYTVFDGAAQLAIVAGVVLFALGTFALWRGRRRDARSALIAICATTAVGTDAANYHGSYETSQALSLTLTIVAGALFVRSVERHQPIRAAAWLLGASVYVTILVDTIAQYFPILSHGWNTAINVSNWLWGLDFVTLVGFVVVTAVVGFRHYMERTRNEAAIPAVDLQASATEESRIDEQ